MAGDFNTPAFNWKRGLPLPNSHYYSKLKGGVFCTFTCLLNLSQCIDIVCNSNLLDLIFSNLSDLYIIPLDAGLVKPDNYQLPLILNIHLPFATYNQILVWGIYNFVSDILPTYDWSYVYGSTFVGFAVASLSAAVQDVMKQAIPRGIINSVEIPTLVFKFLKVLH
jgi:hypothetical protein